MPSPVYDSVQAYQAFEYFQGGYEAANYYGEDVSQAKSHIAQLIGARPHEIALTHSATHAWYSAFWSLDLRAGDVVLVGESAYGSNYMGLLEGKHRLGFEIQVIPSQVTGEIDLEQLESAVNTKVKLICLTHIPTNGGLVNPAERVGEIAQTHQIPYLLDACQSVGQYPISVKDLKCDFLSTTGRKYLRAPRGTGFLYVKTERLPDLRPFMPDLRSANWESETSFQYYPGADRFEQFESYRAGFLGLGAAAAYAHKVGVARIWQRIQFLAEKLRTQLSSIPQVSVHDLGLQKSGLCTFTLQDRTVEAVQATLKARKFNVSISRKGSTLLDMEKRNLSDVVRASVHYYNTEAEIDAFSDTIDHLAR